MMGLTRRQADVLATIKQLSRDGVSPSVREVGAALGIASISSIHHSMIKLVERGYLKHLPRRSRSFVIVEATGDAEGLLAQLAARRGVPRDRLVQQAVSEFLERELRS